MLAVQGNQDDGWGIILVGLVLLYQDNTVFYFYSSTQRSIPVSYTRIVDQISLQLYIVYKTNYRIRV